MTETDFRSALDRIVPDEGTERRTLQQILAGRGAPVRKRGAGRRGALAAAALVLAVCAGFALYRFLPLRAAQAPAAQDMEGEPALARVLNEFQLGNRHYSITGSGPEAFSLPAKAEPKDVGRSLGVISQSPDESLTGCEVYEYEPADAQAVVAVKRNGYELFTFAGFESYRQNRDEDAVQYLAVYNIAAASDISRIELYKTPGTAKPDSVVTDRADIARFYDAYRLLKDGSAAYFQALGGGAGPGAPTGNGGSDGSTAVSPAAPGQGEEKTSPPQGAAQPPDAGNGKSTAVSRADVEPQAGETTPPQGAVNGAAQADGTTAGNAADTPVQENSPGVSSAPASRGGGTASAQGAPQTVSPPQEGTAGKALADSVTIRLCRRNGIYFETVYYPHIRFLSRHRPDVAFAEFLDRLCGIR